MPTSVNEHTLGCVESCRHGQLNVRANSDTDDHEVRLDPGSVGEAQALHVVAALDAFHTDPEPEPNAVESVELAVVLPDLGAQRPLQQRLHRLTDDDVTTALARAHAATSLPIQLPPTTATRRPGSSSSRSARASSSVLRVCTSGRPAPSMRSDRTVEPVASTSRSKRSRRPPSSSTVLSPRSTAVAAVPNRRSISLVT